MALDPTLWRHRLEEKCSVPEDTKEKALDIFEAGLLRLTQLQSRLGSRIMSMCHPVIVDSSVGVDTFAVTLDATRNAFLLINADFITSLADPAHGPPFCLGHEAMHVILQHLDPVLFDSGERDELRTLSEEIVINHLVQQVPGLSGMPLRYLNGTSKEEVGINPAKMYQKYREDLRSHGKDPVDYATFVSSCQRCYTELKRMSRPPRQRRGGDGCSRVSGAPGGSDPMISSDPDAVSDVVEEILQATIEQAKAGDEVARAEIERLASATLDSQIAAEIWGRTGLGSLLNVDLPTKTTEAWRIFLHAAIAKMTQPGCSRRQNRRLVAIDALLGRDPQLGWVGEEERKHLAVYFDTSGSMSSEIVAVVDNLAGRVADAEVRYFGWDCDVYPLDPVNGFSGGGGTDISIVYKHVEEDEFDPDFVIVVTDGYTDRVLPPAADLDHYAFIVTEGGHDWFSEMGAWACRVGDLVPS